MILVKGYVYSSAYDKDNRLTGTVDPLGQTQGIHLRPARQCPDQQSDQRPDHPVPV